MWRAAGKHAVESFFKTLQANKFVFEHVGSENFVVVVLYFVVLVGLQQGAKKVKCFRERI